MVRIPSEYQEVEYIESTGTQWIKTDIESRFTIEYESDIAFTENQDSYSVGCKDGSQRISGNGYWNTTFQIGYGDSYKDFSVGGIKINTRYKLKTILAPDNQNVYVNDVIKGTSTISKATDTLTGKHIAIFGALVDDTTIGQMCKAKLYSLTIRDSDTLLGNFIPCYRKSDSEPGMYDTVSKQFYTNSGTGTFLKGNDVTYNNINLLESRRRILLNTPHIETVSDTIASFKTDIATKIKGCKIHFTPIQEGEGDPSPDNVRPIHGCDGVTVYHNNNSLTIPFPQTIYGGYVDLVKGEVVETTHYTVLDGENIKVNRSYFNSSVNAGYVAAGYVYCRPSGKNSTVRFCDRLTHITSGKTITSTTPIPILRYANSGALFVIIVLGKMEDYPDVTTGAQAIATVNDWLKDNPVGFTYDLTTKVTYPLDPVTIRTLRGLNNIWSDANGNIEVSFYTH